MTRLYGTSLARIKFQGACQLCVLASSLVICSSLNVKQWGAILQLILDKDTDGFKTDLVLVHSMAESLCQALEVLNSSIE